MAAMMRRAPCLFIERSEMLRLIACFAFASPLAAQDVTVQPCDWQASAASLVEPWEDNTRTFSNGQTRLALLDTIEPAAGAFYLLILSPPYAELGERQCRVVGLNGAGFSGLSFEQMQAGYDPAQGLEFLLPAQIFDGESFADHMLRVTLNQNTGQITTQLRP